MKNAKVLREGLEEMARFEIVSKDVGLPLIAVSLKDTRKHTIFKIAESMRSSDGSFLHTVSPDTKQVVVLRVVIRRTLARASRSALIQT